MNGMENVVWSADMAMSGVLLPSASGEGAGPGATKAPDVTVEYDALSSLGASAAVPLLALLLKHGCQLQWKWLAQEQSFAQNPHLQRWVRAGAAVERRIKALRKQQALLTGPKVAAGAAAQQWSRGGAETGKAKGHGQTPAVTAGMTAKLSALEAEVAELAALRLRADAEGVAELLA